MKPLLAMLSFVAALCVSPPAHADWEFTTWGMSPRDLIFHSDGAARWAPRDEPYRTSQPALLVVGEFSLEGVEYETAFYFHDRVELDAVYIKPREITAEACTALRDAFSRYVGVGSVPGYSASEVRWPEGGSNFVARYYEALASRYGPMCSVSIRENDDIVVRRTRRRS